MKKRLNKALALLIAVMLVIGIMPTAFADGGEETLPLSGVKIVYDLYNNTDVTGQTTITGVGFPATKGFWAFEKQSGSFAINRNNNNGLEVQCGVNVWWAIRVYVPKAGSYELSLNHSLRNNGGTSEIYFGKADETADSIASGTALLNKIIFYHGSTDPEYGRITPAGNVKVSVPGEYIIVFKSIGQGDTTSTGTTGSSARQYFKEVILDGCEEGTETAATIGSIKLGETDSISAGSTAELTTTAYNGITAETIDASAVTYESSNSSILSIDGSTATAHKPGTVTITANSESWGNPVEKTVTVAPAVPYSNAEVVYDIGSAGKDTASKTFVTTNGFWEFDRIESKSYSFNTSSTAAKLQVNIAPNEWWAVKVFVPKAGSYQLNINRLLHKWGGQSEIYFGEAGEDNCVENIVEDSSKKVGEIGFYAETAATSLDAANVGIVTASTSGEYFIVFKAISRADGSENKQTTSYYARQFFKEVILDGCIGAEPTYVPMLNVTADPDTIKVGDTTAVTATSTLMSDGVTEVTPTISYETSDIVSMNGTTVTALSDGVATVTATAMVGDASSSRSVNITVNNKEISDGFNAEDDTETYAPSVTAYTYKDGQSAVLENTETDTYITDNGDGTYTLAAPNDEGTYKFLYWVKGLETKKRVISTSRSFTYRATKDNSHLIAVYENTADESEAKAEFYNANMQLIESNDTGKVPALPVLAGYGEAIAWVSEDGTEYTTAGATATLNATGTTMFIAKYKDEDELEPIEITATNATVSNANPAYGEKITVTANADTEGNVFQYFTKNNEVVCLDREYSYNAYKTETVVAVYGEKKPTYIGNTRKIFLDAFDVTASEKGLMAEFIGFENDNVVEKGIMLGTRKMPMTTTKTQFTIIADEEETYKGYAIIKDGESFLIITDGEYTKK